MYLDANASASLRPEAKRAVQELLHCDTALNPSSVHARGRAARAQLTKARKQILRALGSGDLLDAKLIFTGGGTESCNCLAAGFLSAMPGPVVTSAIEHPAMLESLRRYASAVAEIIPNSSGVIDVEKLVSAVSTDTAIVSLMAANNENGALQPIVEVARYLRKKKFAGVIISDFTQAFGKSDLKLSELFAAGVDAAAISGHKIGALSGIGAVILANSSERCFRFEPLLVGGPQEKRFRAGTENIFGAVSFGAAAEAVMLTGEAERKRILQLRELLWQKLVKSPLTITSLTPGVGNCCGTALGNTLLTRFHGIRGDDLVVALDLHGVQASTGSACSSGRQDVSPVVRAMGFAEGGREVVRFSFDVDADELTVRRTAQIIIDVACNFITTKQEANDGTVG